MSQIVLILDYILDTFVENSGFSLLPLLLEARGETVKMLNL